MQGFRQHLHMLLRLALAMWVVAFSVATVQGCLVLPSHDLPAPHNQFANPQQFDEHALHANGVLQHCADASSTVSPAIQASAFDLAGWIILLALPVLLLLDIQGPPASVFSPCRRPAPPGPPARLSFVRFND
ncbi:hypothetical protein [Pseudomonas sp. 2FE]|uniref:hypothetical protein n=1 Tax=Pseudomonas sp. 2FE TaxID=2502190 RepID=UPI0010F5A26F|nr:hypothetical protein [Pseudomonas sp. 2FE]